GAGHRQDRQVLDLGAAARGRVRRPAPGSGRRRGRRAVPAGHRRRGQPAAAALPAAGRRRRGHRRAGRAGRAGPGPGRRLGRTTVSGHDAAAAPPAAGAPQQRPADGRGLKRVLGLPSLFFFGLAYMVPLAAFTTYGIVTDMTRGHLPTAFLVTLAAMAFSPLG